MSGWCEAEADLREFLGSRPGDRDRDRDLDWLPRLPLLARRLEGELDVEPLFLCLKEAKGWKRERKEHKWSSSDRLEPVENYKGTNCCHGRSPVRAIAGPEAGPGETREIHCGHSPALLGQRCSLFAPHCSLQVFLQNYCVSSISICTRPTVFTGRVKINTDENWHVRKKEIRTQLIRKIHPTPALWTKPASRCWKQSAGSVYTAASAPPQALLSLLLRT